MRYVLPVACALLLVACVPVPLRYWVPSAEGMTVVSNSCLDEPPYRAVYRDGSATTSLLLSGSTLSLLVSVPEVRAIGFDPTAVRVTAGDTSVGLANYKYLTGEVIPAPETAVMGPTLVRAKHVEFVATLNVKYQPEVRVHLPTITLDGDPVDVPDVTFKRESHVKVVLLIANC
jgi:hypothetical protein